MPKRNEETGKLPSLWRFVRTACCLTQLLSQNSGTFFLVFSQDNAHEPGKSEVLAVSSVWSRVQHWMGQPCPAKLSETLLRQQGPLPEAPGHGVPAQGSVLLGNQAGLPTSWNQPLTSTPQITRPTSPGAERPHSSRAQAHSGCTGNAQPPVEHLTSHLAGTMVPSDGGEVKSWLERAYW